MNCFFNGDSEDEFMGAIKIKDGLFIGDEFSAQVGFGQTYYKRSLAHFIDCFVVFVVRTLNL